MAEDTKMKPIRVKAAYFDRIRDLRYKLMEARGIDVSLADTVMEGVKLLEDKMESQK